MLGMYPAAPALNREVIHQIFPQHPSGIADALRICDASLGVEENPS